MMDGFESSLRAESNCLGGWVGYGGDKKGDVRYDSQISFSRHWIKVGAINQDKKHWADFPNYFFLLFFLLPSTSAFILKKSLDVTLQCLKDCIWPLNLTSFPKLFISLCFSISYF